jgi:hypothetical protein
MGLACSKVPERCEGGSVSIGRASRARQVKGEDPDKKKYPCPPGWGLCVKTTTSLLKKVYVKKIAETLRLGIEEWTHL